MKLNLLLVALLVGTATATAADPPATALPKAQRDAVVKKYTDAGLPSPDTVWGGKEYAAAVKAMQKIKKDAKLPLPRRDVLLYRPIFQRFVSDENLAFFDDKELSASDAIDEANEVVVPVNGLLLVYFDTSVPDVMNSPQPYGTEAIEMLLFVFKISNGLLRRLDEVEATLTDEGRKAESYIAGTKQVREGINQMLSGATILFGELGVYTERDLSDFAVRFRKLSPALLAYVPAEDRAKHLKKLKKLAVNHPIPAVRTALADLVASVEP